MRLLPKSIHRCRRYPTKFNSGRDISLGRGYYENAPETTKEKGRRNGYESHRVLTGEGAVTVQVPQIRETSTGFRSKILDAYCESDGKTG